MTLAGRRKIIALGLVTLLITSTIVGYCILRPQPVTASKNNETTTIPTVYDPGPVKSLFTFGPPEGYEPLTVNFYGNPENDSTIVSYKWDFGPDTAAILSQSTYDAIVSKPIFKLLGLILGVSIVTFFISGFNIQLGFGAWTIGFITALLMMLIFGVQVRGNRQFISTERAPSMIFLDYGSYSAKLTVTYKNGTTASETSWITVLQYIPPDIDNHDNDSMTLRETLLNRYISRRTWTQIGG
jgi:hypothetical protein